MKDVGSPVQQHGSGPEQSHLEGDAAVVRPRPELRDGATELLAIVAYISAGDGPVRASRGSADRLSPWHQRLLQKAMERLDVIDADLRGRVAFLVAGKDHGYYASESELELAGTALDACRATSTVVDALLAGRLPTVREFEAVSDTALRIYPALEAMDARAARPW